MILVQDQCLSYYQNQQAEGPQSMRNRPPSAPSTAPVSQNQLGEFLRAKRDQLRPEDVGLPPGFRRRAPGLRREEVATLCHISPTW